MDTWLSITIIFAALIIFLFFIGWLDWKYKCRKTVKENNLTIYLNGYAILKNDYDESTINILSGVLGVNSKDLIFVNRFQDDSLKVAKELSDVTNFEIYTYEENGFLELIRNRFKLHELKVKYIIYNMAGLSVTHRVPELIKSRLLCKIDFSNDSALLFSYKNSQINSETMQKISSCINSKQT